MILPVKVPYRHQLPSLSSGVAIVAFGTADGDSSGDGDGFGVGFGVGVGVANPVLMLTRTIWPVFTTVPELGD